MIWVLLWTLSCIPFMHIIKLYRDGLRSFFDWFFDDLETAFMVHLIGFMMGPTLWLVTYYEWKKDKERDNVKYWYYGDDVYKQLICLKILIPVTPKGGGVEYFKLGKYKIK